MQDAREADRLLDEAEIAADRAANKARVIAGIVLLVTVWLVGFTVPADARLIQAQVHGGKITLVCWLLVGLAGMALNRLGFRHPAIGYGQVTVDALLIGANLYFGFAVGGLGGNFWPVFPAVWLLPLVVGASALRWRPRLTLYSGVLGIGVVLLVTVLVGHSDGEERAQQAANTPLLFGWPPNSVRFVMLALLVAVVALVTWRGRALVQQAAAEARRREALGRHLPRRVLPLILDPDLAELRRGAHRELGIMFVDIRGSTAIAARMAPAAFAELLAGFRREVGDAAERHEGVVDKFIGDGALILFGILPGETDPAGRAIRCGREIADRLGRAAAYDFGIGIHVGPVFVGVVGEGDRVEFTALGDPVNQTARLEKATKAMGCRLLVSAAAVAASGRPPTAFSLHERAPVVLEGVPGLVAVFADQP